MMLRCLLVATALSLTTVVVAQTPGYALIVTSNRSHSASRPDLHYADDDGVQYAALFADLLGAERVTLLTQLDAETTALHPQVSARAPTHVNLIAAVRQLAAQLQRARASGLEPVVYVVLAGHGDIDRGQGYFDLEDGGLTARELDELVITPLPAARIHLVVDSCNSYFLISPRKPGGKRWQSDHSAARDLLSKHSHVGAFLSTSAEALTYEWSEVQSGIFSYEVRAGLRGAADVDGDGHITYAELAGFIRVANRPVVNDLYRPKVFAKPPALDARKAGANAVLARLPAPGERAGRRLSLDARDDQRLTLRDPNGIRVMDIHKEAGTPFTLLLPSDVALSAQAQLAGSERPRWEERDIPEGIQAWASLAPRPARQHQRGDAPLFRAIFAEPFGRRAFARVQAEAKPLDEPPMGITTRDVDRLRLQLSLAASTASGTRVATGVSWLLYVTLPTAALTYAIYSNVEHSGAWFVQSGFATGAALSAVSLGLGAYMLTTSWSEERLYGKFVREDVSTESARSRVVPKYELALRDLAVSSGRSRHTGGWFAFAGGAIEVVTGGVLLREDLARGRTLRHETFLNLLMGVGHLAFAWYLLGSKGPLESVWETYAHDVAP